MFEMGLIFSPISVYIPSRTINDKRVRTYRSVLVTKGSVLKFGQANKGCRTYLAVAGGVQISKVMQSYSTYLRAGIGGYYGRSLQKEDIIYIGGYSENNYKLWSILHRQRVKDEKFTESKWTVNIKLKPCFPVDPTLRVFEGSEHDWLTDESQQIIFSKTFGISPESDRMGYRLIGPKLKLKYREELLSEAVTFGTIQAPMGYGNDSQIEGPHK